VLVALEVQHKLTHLSTPVSTHAKLMPTLDMAQ